MFCIDDNNSIYFGDPRAVNVSPFSCHGELGNIANAREWSKQTVTDIWNGFAGTAGPFADLKPQKLFKNRPYGLAQIWKAIQRLVPSDEASEPVAPVVDTVGDMPKKKAKRAKKVQTTVI